MTCQGVPYLKQNVYFYLGSSKFSVSHLMKFEREKDEVDILSEYVKKNCYRKVENTKGVIRSRISKKYRQHNDHKK